MLRFKQFLIESPLPPDEKEIRDIQNYLYSKEAKGNEAMVLGLHGGPNDPTIGYGHSLKDKKNFLAMMSYKNYLTMILQMNIKN
jgi:hypothetical protein